MANVTKEIAMKETKKDLNIGGSYSSAILPHWMGAFPRTGADLLPPEVETIRRYLKDGKTIRGISNEVLRSCDEVSQILTSYCPNYSAYIWGEYSNSLTSVYDVNFSYLFKPEVVTEPDGTYSPIFRGYALAGFILILCGIFLFL